MNIRRGAFAMLAFVPVYYHLNVGGSGLFLPVNALIWGAVSIFVLWYLAKAERMCENSFQAVVGLLIVVLAGFLSGIHHPVQWALIIVGLLISGAFFVIMTGLLVDPVRQYQFLLFCLFTLFLHSIAGGLQMFPPLFDGMVQWLPYTDKHLSIGIFQQANLQASAMATALVMSLYFVLWPGFEARHPLVKTLPVMTVFFSSLELMSIGSRVGLLGGSAALLIMLLTQFSQLKGRGGWVCVLMLALVAGGGIGSSVGDGLLRAYSKIERLSEEGRDVRPHVYRVSFDAFLDKPFMGHGIGSFERIFHQKAAAYQAANEGESLIGGGRYTHPHNETLLWAVEGGILALAGIITCIVITLRQLWLAGWKKGGGVLALLLPIILHSQVELPFYLSAYHWMLFLMMLALLYAQAAESCKLYRLGRQFRKMLLGIFGVLMAATVFFSATAFHYSKRIGVVLYSDNGRLSELQQIAKHPYFTDFAATYIYRLNFLQSDGDEKIAAAEMLVNWGVPYLNESPDAEIWVDVIQALVFLDRVSEARLLMDRALYYYPNQPVLMELRSQLGLE